MVWAIAILCVSLSCEPIPIMAGWFFSNEDCIGAAQQVVASWRPTQGLYHVECVMRLVV